MPGNNAHQKDIKTAGQSLQQAEKALIMVHGRGARAEDILSLAKYFPVADYAVLAPQATNHSWYPYSFLAPPAQNEPWLSSALALLKEVIEDVVAAGIAPENVYFLGFSQGACLALEFVSRTAQRYGGVAAFSGGLIGDKINPENYRGDFNGTPVFIGSSNPDMHIPVERVYATANILRDLHAAVTEKIYERMGHTINEDEIMRVNQLLFTSSDKT